MSKDKKNSRDIGATDDKQDKDLAFHYWHTLTYLVNLIKSSELKAGLILSFYGIIFNFMYQNIERTKSQFDDNPLLFVLLGVWILCTIISIYHSVRSFIPRIESNYDKNVFFFGDIISKFGSITEYSKSFYEISTDGNQRFDHLGQQVFIQAKIAATKLKNVNKSLRYLAIGLGILLIFVVYSLVLTLL